MIQRCGDLVIAASRKPNSVSTFRRMTIIPLAPPLLAGSSNRPGSIRRAVLLPYLVLLRAGFCLPPMLPPARCALTAPFHPYPRQAEGGIFSVPLSFELPRPGVTRRTALRSSDFPPSTVASCGASADGDRLAHCDRRYCSLRWTRAARSGSRRCVSRRFLGKSGTARASCTNCCAACRSLPRFWRCSSRFPGACRRETRARRYL
jgi:hypothetical protein